MTIRCKPKTLSYPSCKIRLCKTMEWESILGIWTSILQYDARTQALSWSLRTSRTYSKCRRRSRASTTSLRTKIYEINQLPMPQNILSRRMRQRLNRSNCKIQLSSKTWLWIWTYHSIQATPSITLAGKELSWLRTCMICHGSYKLRRTTLKRLRTSR